MDEFYARSRCNCHTGVIASDFGLLLLCFCFLLLFLLFICFCFVNVFYFGFCFVICCFGLLLGKKFGGRCLFGFFVVVILFVVVCFLLLFFVCVGGWVGVWGGSSFSDGGRGKINRAP